MNLINAKYGNVPGLKGYSHVSDQYAPFATQVIPATVSEAPYILDGLLMKASPQGLFARQRFLGHKRNMGYATRFNRAIGSLSGWNSPAGSRLACSQR